MAREAREVASAGLEQRTHCDTGIWEHRNGFCSWKMMGLVLGELDLRSPWEMQVHMNWTDYLRRRMCR